MTNPAVEQRGYTLDAFIDMKIKENNIRHEQSKDLVFPSCAHCVEYKRHCIKLESKLKVLKHSWSYNDSTRCQSFKSIAYEEV